MSGHGYDDGLTADERALARALARVDAGDGPSPALDAAILAHARDAVTLASRTAAAPAAGGAPPSLHPTGVATRRRPRLRWAAGLGIAASMVVAVGIAWQLRPTQGDAIEFSEAPAAAVVRDAAPAARVATPPAAAGSAMHPGAPADDAAAAEAAPPAATSAPQRSAARPAPAAPAADDPPVVYDAPAPMDAPPPPPPPSPPAPAAAAAPQPQAFPPSPPAAAVAGGAAESRPSAQKTADAEAARQLRSRDAATRAQQSAAERESLDSIVVSGTRIRAESAARAPREDARAHADGFHDQPLDDTPPATVDSPDVQQAWLQRIRELVADGQLDAARDSAAEFRRRYPDIALPADIAPALE